MNIYYYHTNVIIGCEIVCTRPPPYLYVNIYLKQETSPLSQNPKQSIHVNYKQRQDLGLVDSDETIMFSCPCLLTTPYVYSQKHKGSQQICDMINMSITHEACHKTMFVSDRFFK